MKVTLQQIADKAGVSRGTVDRVLNHRGKVKPEVNERVLRIAKELNYQPNKLGRALVMSRKKMKIGMLLQATDTPFMQTVMKGVQDARKEIEAMNVELLVREVSDQKTEKAVREIRELLDQGCQALAVMPKNTEEFAQLINECSLQGIPVITVNSDLENTSRVCFVGQDARQAGRAAADLMRELLPEGGHVLMISGYRHNRSHVKRDEGFREELSRIRPDLHIEGPFFANDDEQVSFSMASEFIQQFPADPRHPLGIFLSAAGVEGTCQAISSCSASESVRVICYDQTDENIRLMKEGYIRFIIGQDGYRQGYEPLMLLFSWFFYGTELPKGERLTEIKIKTSYNIP